MIDLENFKIIISGSTIIPSFNVQIGTGEQWVVTGDSGSGKTSLLHAIAGGQAHGGKLVFSNTSSQQKLKLVMVEQQHRFRNLSNTSTFYYQQRFNSAGTYDANTLEQDIKNSLGLQEEDLLPGEALEAIQWLHIGHLLQTRLIQLSNGENKRLQIAKAILMKPDLLLLDNPLIGLDVEARANLTELLKTIIGRGIQLIVAMSAAEIPDYFTHVLVLKKAESPQVLRLNEFRHTAVKPLERTRRIIAGSLFEKLVLSAADETFEIAVRMENVNIRYEGRKILDDINWEVRRGDKWAISGANGAGKSTLLSLVNADNPQAYANRIYLFDRKRGSGESIWDIKKKIGFVSPELHLFFDSSTNCGEVVASGLFDTVGLFRLLNEQQEALVDEWMQLLEIGHLRVKGFSRISLSEQRLVLLARALVKNPPMLILDEPCQGLDDHQVDYFKNLVNEICIRAGKTLLYVSHYKPEIPACVDKFLRLDAGKIVTD
ncbi:MAG: ATP-binding cassette domain-containing protein [Chitinophagaceae bacterium]